MIIAAAEKCRNRSQSDQKDWITLLWSPEDNAKATKTLLDHAMCVASRKKLENPQIKTIVTAWLNSLNFDPNDSNLDLEVEKYVALDEHSTLSYIIGHRLVQKVKRTSIKRPNNKFFLESSCSLNTNSGFIVLIVDVVLILVTFRPII